MPNEATPVPGEELSVRIRQDVDIVDARQQGRARAVAIGFTGSDLTLIATVISELGRNILTYAQRGEIVLATVERAGRKGIQVIARDQGPGIADIALAMQDGYSTSNSLGLGLPGTRRLMDEFDLVSTVGQGTTVTVRKWVK